MLVVAGLIINRVIKGHEERHEYLKYLESYVPYVDKLYILNVTKQDLSAFYQEVKKYPNIEIADSDDYGEVNNYNIILEEAIKDQATYGLIMELGYYFQDEAFNALRKFVIQKKVEDVAVITPAPLYGCQIHERKAESYREIKGCKLIGAFVNLDIYQKLGGFDLEYYQTTFDYDYCIRARLNNYKLLLLQNEVVRNVNYKIIERKIFFTSLTTFDKDPMELYYETRNKLFLWDKYKNQDLEYVKIDKRITKAELHELRVRDTRFGDKKIMMNYAKRDYKAKLRGQYTPRNF